MLQNNKGGECLAAAGKRSWTLQEGKAWKEVYIYYIFYIQRSLHYKKWIYSLE